MEMSIASHLSKMDPYPYLWFGYEEGKGKACKQTFFGTPGMLTDQRCSTQSPLNTKIYC